MQVFVRDPFAPLFEPAALAAIKRLPASARAAYGPDEHLQRHLIGDGRMYHTGKNNYNNAVPT